MFSNIGAKIKGLAKFIFWVICIISIIAGIVTIIQAMANSYSNSSSKIYAIIAGFLIAVGGTILAWLQNFLLYGFGELIDSNQKILRIMEERNMDRIVSEKSYSEPVYREPQKQEVQQTIPLQSVVQSDNK